MVVILLVFLESCPALNGKNDTIHRFLLAAGVTVSYPVIYLEQNLLQGQSRVSLGSRKLLWL